MLLPIHLPPQRGPLQRPGPQVEGERDQRIVLTIGQGHVDQPQDSAFCDLDIPTQKILGLQLSNALLVPVLLMVPNQMTVAD